MEENNLRKSLQAKYDFYFQEVREHPDASHLQVGLADACLALSKRREALLYYKKALALDPANENVARLLLSNFSADEMKGVEIALKVDPFWRRPGKVVSYPLKKHGLYTLIAAAFAGGVCGSVPIFGDLLTLLFFLPMTLLAAAVSEKLLVPFQFRTILTGIWKIRGHYLIMLCTVGCVLGLQRLLALFMPYSIFFLGPALFWLITVYFDIVLMRLLGNTYAINRDRLKWR